MGRSWTGYEAGTSSAVRLGRPVDHPAIDCAGLQGLLPSDLVSLDQVFPLQDRLVMKGSPVRVRASALGFETLQRKVTPRVTLPPGRYRVTVRVTFERGSGSPPVTLAGTVRICRPFASLPVTG